MSVRLSLMCRPHLVPGGDLRACLDIAQVADRAGYHSIHFGEHVLMGEHTERYPYGTFVHDPATPWLEPMTTLAAMAAVTTRLRLSTGVLLVPLRPAALLAKTIATLDVLSGGRVELGVGTGWQKEEYDASGVPWKDRNRLMDETIEACRALWGEQPVTHRSSVLEVDGVRALPVPVQHRVPLIFGVAMTEANARRITLLGDGWVPVNLTADEVGVGVDRLRDAYDVAGRTDEPIVRAQPPMVTNDGRPDVTRTLAGVPDYLAAGANVISFMLPPGLTSMRETEDLVEEVASVAAQYG